MIVKYQQNGWKVITQRAHGMLAFQLASKWKYSKPHPRRMELLLAVAEHDDAEVELDGENLLTPQGGPLNFDMKNFEPEHCKKLSEFSLTKSRYIALLTSMHMKFLYEKDTASDKEAKRFLQEQEKLQADWKKELGISDKEAAQDYALLEWCDALSLLLCQEAVQPEKRSIEISNGPDDKKYLLNETSEGNLTVLPWPFDDKSFEVRVEYRIISELTFRDSAAFRTAFYKAPVSEHSWIMTATNK